MGLVVLLALVLCSSAFGDDFDDYFDDSQPSDFLVSSTPDIRYVLFTRKNPSVFQILNFASKSEIEKSNFNFGNPTKILAYGWKGNLSDEQIINIRDAYLNTSDSNIIVIDWAPIAGSSYRKTLSVVRLVSDFVVQLLGLLVQFGVSPDDIHLIGYGFGAHLVGLAGKNAPVQVARVTGLDPAGLFYSFFDSDIISTESARFVDIIHTCGRYLGYEGQLGHADFYPNGGTHSQRGCGFDFGGKCSSERASLLFAESIRNPQAFPAVPCWGWWLFRLHICSRKNPIFMGEMTPQNAKGSYYLTTNEEPPYGKGVV